MSVRSPRLPRKPSQREIRNNLAGLDALANGTTPVFEAPPAPRSSSSRTSSPAPKRTLEKDVMDAIRQWARAKSMILFRNNVGSFEWKPGRWLRYGLCNGSSDFIGYQSITITPDLIGKRVAVLCAIEAKASTGGVVSDDQEQFLNQVRDAGAICGVAKSVDDCEDIVARWRKR